MPIDIERLEKVRHLGAGKVEAACPACAEAGRDSTGNHLVIFADGRFGCVANEGDTTHRKRIWALVGEGRITGERKAQRTKPMESKTTPKRALIRALRHAALRPVLPHPNEPQSVTQATPATATIEEERAKLNAMNLDANTHAIALRAIETLGGKVVGDPLHIPSLDDVPPGGRGVVLVRRGKGLVETVTPFAADDAPMRWGILTHDGWQRGGKIIYTRADSTGRPPKRIPSNAPTARVNFERSEVLQ